MQKLQENRFNKLLKEKEFLIMGHRGFWGGNVIQNTRQSFALAFKAGADIAETDVHKSKDGVFYLFHNGYEKFLLDLDQPMAELTSEEIDSRICLNSMRSESGYRLEKFADFLEWMPQDWLLNVDRTWFYFDDPELFELIEKSGKADQIFLKSRMDKTYLENLNNMNTDIAFMPIVESQSDFEEVLKYENINTIGIETIIETEESDLLDPVWLKGLNDNGYLITGNAEKLGTKHVFFYGLTDDNSLFEDEEITWGKMVRLGMNIVLTHWPNFVNDYRNRFQR